MKVRMKQINWEYIKREISAMNELSRDESLPIGLRLEIKNTLKEIKEETEKLILQIEMGLI